MKLKDFIKKLKNKYSFASLYIKPMPNGSILLGRIKIPVRKRGQGIGHQIINDLKKYADTNQIKIFLTPSDTLGGDLDRLRTFYSSLGFTKSDDGDYELMYQPKITEQIKQMLREINTTSYQPREYEHLIGKTIESWVYESTVYCTKPKKRKWVVGDVRLFVKDPARIIIQSEDRLHTLIQYIPDIHDLINGEIITNIYGCKIARIDYGDDFGLMAKSHIDENHPIPDEDEEEDWQTGEESEIDPDASDDPFGDSDEDEIF